MTTSEQRPRATDSTDGSPSNTQRVPCTIRQLALYFLRLGTFGFGGPIALAGYMQEPLLIVAAGVVGIALKATLG